MTGRLFSYLIADNYQAFSGLLCLEPNLITGCWSQAQLTNNGEVIARFNYYVFTVLQLIMPDRINFTSTITRAIASQYPTALAGAAVSLQLGSAHLEVTVGSNSSFAGMTIEQMSRNLNRSQSTIETAIFKAQIDAVGELRSKQTLNLKDTFIHPLSECTLSGGDIITLNEYGVATKLLNVAYLEIEVDLNQQANARAAITDLVGDELNPVVLRLLRVRHLPTIYFICNRLVEVLENGSYKL